MSFVIPVNGKYQTYTLTENKKQQINTVHRSDSVDPVSEDADELVQSFSGGRMEKKDSAAHRNYQKVQSQRPKILRAKNIMTNKVLAVEENTRLQKIRDEMKRHQIHHLPVMGKGQILVGMISDRDLLRHLNPELKASSIMSTPLIVAIDSTPVKSIAQLFIQENISAVPIIDYREKLVGIVTHRDILKCLMRQNILNQEI
jgi:acetoin utilization protein AcuB